MLATHGNAQDLVWLTVTGRGDGWIAGTLSGYATYSKPGTAPVPMPVQGSFLAEIAGTY